MKYMPALLFVVTFAVIHCQTIPYCVDIPPYMKCEDIKVCNSTITSERCDSDSSAYLENATTCYCFSVYGIPQEGTTSEASSGSESGQQAAAGGAVLRSLRALHADVRDIWRALDARRGHHASPETSSCNAASTSQTRLTLSAPDPIIQDNSDAGVSERVRGLRAWLQTAP